MTLSRAHRAHFFKLEIRKKLRDILSEKWESGMALKSMSLHPKAVMLTPMPDLPRLSSSWSIGQHIGTWRVEIRMNGRTMRDSMNFTIRPVTYGNQTRGQFLLELQLN